MFSYLLTELDKNGFQVFAYGDDLAVIGRNKTRLIEAIKIIEKWTENNKMKINKKKSGVIFFKRKGNKKLYMDANENQIEGYPVV